MFPAIVLALLVVLSKASFEVPLHHILSSPLMCAQLRAGSPPQNLTVQIDSASSILWVPQKGGFRAGFAPGSSSTAVAGKEVEMQPYADGLQVAGTSYHDVLSLGNSEARMSPFLVASSSGEDMGGGIIGLGCPREGADKEPVEGFFCRFWKDHAQLPKTFRLEFAGPAPRMILGEPLVEGLRSKGGLRLASTYFTSRTELWYASVRALGFSAGGRTSWNLDFNVAFSSGAAALLDSGSSDIRVGSVVFDLIMKGLPTGCSAEDTTRQIRCPCEDVSSFPSLSLSFEAKHNYRFLGLDGGADFITCIPASAYVVQMPPGSHGALHSKPMCRLRIVDGGRNHMMFGVESIVLGMPFFHAAVVAYDADARQVGIAGLDLPPGQCADPKNWWYTGPGCTGRRFSWRRCSVVLSLTASVVLYAFLFHSRSRVARGIRGCLGLPDRSGSARELGWDVGEADANRAADAGGEHSGTEFVAFQSDAEQ